MDNSWQSRIANADHLKLSRPFGVGPLYLFAIYKSAISGIPVNPCVVSKLEAA